MLSGGQIVSTGVVVYQAGSGVTDYATSATGIVVSTSQFDLGPASTEYVLSGGSTTGTKVESGGSAIVYSGGSVTSSTVYSGGYETVSAGGTASYDTISHGTQFVGGSALSTTVSSGGVEYLSGGGSTTGTTVSSGGIEQATGGATTTSTFVGSSGTEYIYSGSIANDTTVANGGVVVANFHGQVVSATINSGGYEVLSGGTASFTSMNIGASILLPNLGYNSSTETVNFDSSTDLLTVSSGTYVSSQTLAGNYSGDSFALSNYPNGSFSETLVTLGGPPCYCLGTLILTNRGERAVEDLGIGDHVITLSGAARPIRWIGRRHLNLLRHPAPDQVRPILIRADAIADGAPRRDLRVSPDHAVLFGRGLIPARLLVNGASIQQEVECQSTTYYHVELDTHDILLAEGLPAESYLDTGNRGLFENAEAPLILHPDGREGQEQRIATSCRPFVDQPAEVEPVWRSLAMRAVLLGLRLPMEPETTVNPGLHVIVDGRTIAPIRVEAMRYTFVLPPTNGPVRLVSRSVNPSAVRPWVEDRRRLGVMVSHMTLWTGGPALAVPLDDPRLSDGWWDIERDNATMWRWTDGNAVIALPAAESAMLEVTLAETLDYPLHQDVEPHAAARHRKNPAAA